MEGDVQISHRIMIHDTKIVKKGKNWDFLASNFKFNHAFSATDDKACRKRYGTTIWEARIPESRIIFQEKGSRQLETIFFTHKHWLL